MWMYYNKRKTEPTQDDKKTFRSDDQEIILLILL